MNGYLGEIDDKLKLSRKKGISREDFLTRSALAGVIYNRKQKDLNKKLYGNNEPSHRTISDLNVSALPFKPTPRFRFNPETQS